MEETVPKRLEHDSQQVCQRSAHAVDEPAGGSEPSIPSRNVDPVTTQRLSPIESLIPDDMESAVKAEAIFRDKTQLFDGRYDAASVCALLATLDEADLRCLRDQLHAVLPEQVPAAGGRPLIRRNSGSSSRLVDDCWALGSSATQGILTRFADSQTLRAAERSAHSELVVPATSTASDMTAVRSSIEALIATQLRLEKEVTALRNHSRAQDRRLDELTRELKEARRIAAAAGRPPVVNTDCESMEPRVNTTQCPLTTPVRVEAAADPGTEQRAAGATAMLASHTMRLPLPPPGCIGASVRGATVEQLQSRPSEQETQPATLPDRPELQQSTVRPPLPPPGCFGASARGAAVEQRRPSEDTRRAVLPDPDRPELQQSSLAQDIAANLDLRSLAMAIVSAMQSQAPDSDSDAENDEWPPLSRPSQGGPTRSGPQRRFRRGTGSSTSYTPITRANARSELATSHPQNFSAVGPAALPDRSSPITGTGTPSGLVATTAAREQSSRATYVLEGIAHDASDSQVRAMVSPLVQRLHDFRRLSRHAGAASGLKAYRIEVDAADDPWVMNPVNWPAGLRVRPWTVKQRHEETFRAGEADRQPRQQQQSWWGGARFQRPTSSTTSTRVWYNRNSAQ